MSATGGLSGTPSSTGTYSFSVQVTDAGAPAQTDQASFVIAVDAPLSISTPSLNPGVVTAAYSHRLIAAGGLTPYRWTLAAGQLPSGIVLSTDGVISGNPAVEGIFDCTVRVTDSALPERTATRSFQLSIEQGVLRIRTQELPAGISGYPYSYSLNADGGPRPHTWDVVAGALPEGFVLSSAGLLHGTPSLIGSAIVRMRVRDSSGLSDTRDFTISVGPPIVPPSVTGVPKSVNPTQQLPFGLSLFTPYPFAVSGTLTIDFTPSASVADDPAVQFSTGGRTVNFTIPVNSTSALLPPQLRLLTGTVAGTITINCTIENGPPDLSVASVAVDSSAPRISSVGVNRINGGLRVQVIGFSPDRQVTNVDFLFDVRTPTGMEQVNLTKAVDSEFGEWYRSAASVPFGSTFLFEQMFGVQGDTDTVEAITITLKNARGTGSPSRAAIPAN
jgi:hypothetical protein